MGPASNVKPGAVTSRRQRQTHPKLAIALLCFITVMGVYLIVGGLHRRHQLTAVSGGIVATGTVIGVRVDDSGSQGLYAPVVVFSTTSGRRIEFTAPTGTSRPAVGSSAQVSYSPQDPSQAHDLSDLDASWRWPFYTGLFVLVFDVLLVLVVARSLLRRRRQHSPDLAELRS
jgi:Protein of unknown function (DUF3592)